ncbi:MAG: TolC family protein [Candidatus Omnitrophica bacterium]|nr:TolC family protein [Candidatus Omnitrophota bacterium]
MPRHLKIILIFTLSLFIYSNQAAAQEILTWGDCLSGAKQNHPDLISAVEDVKVQKADKVITASGLYPQISTDLDASTTETSAATRDSYSYGVSGSQLIFDGFKTFNEIKSAGEDIKSSRQAYRFTSSQIRLDLRSAFVNLLKAQELIALAKEIVEIRRSSFELITLRYHSGLEHKGALLTAEANLKKADFELNQAYREFAFRQRQLNKEMGRKEFTPLSVKGDFLVRESVKVKPDLESLVKNNPSVLQAAAQKNSSAFGIKSAYADFAPQVSGTAGADKSGSRWPPQDNQWNLGLGLSLPIFEGGLRFAQVSKAEAIYNQAEASERSITDAAIVYLQETWMSLEDAIESIDVQQKSLEASQERSKIAEAQYSTGFIGFDNWIIIEDDLVGAKKNYLNARAEALLAEAQWIQAKGETLEYAQ